MTAARAGQGDRPGLLERLLAAVRPQFRDELLVPDPANPVLGWKICAAAGLWPAGAYQDHVRCA